VCGSGGVVCSLSLLIRWAQRARCQAETPLIVLFRFLTSRARASSAMAPHLPDADQPDYPAGQTRELPVPAKEAYHAGLPRALALACSIILPSVISTASAPRIFLSRLNGWPVPSPTDASALASRPPMHGSGTMRFATPSSCRTFTDYFSPVSRRTEIRTPDPQMRSASGVE
jgi:hypothetical protein